MVLRASPDGDEANSQLIHIATSGPLTVVIDEFPLLAQSRARTAVHQCKRALDPAAPPGNIPVRLLLCGSALSCMGRLLIGTAALRGRAGLELVVPTLDFRLAAQFWEIVDLPTAVFTHAIVGGTLPTAANSPG